MNKSEMLTALQESREKFLKTLEGLSDQEMEKPGVTGQWSVKDILAHISRWEAEMVRMLWQLQQEQTPDTAHFANRNVDELNAEWQKEMASRPLEMVMADFHAVRKQTIRRVEGFSDKDLSDPQRYPELKGQPLENWIAGDSFEHEAEHAADIQAWRARKEDQ